MEEANRGLTATMTATALEHPNTGAHACLARAVAASLQHALGRAPVLDGRFHTQEYEALPTVQTELAERAMSADSEVNFLRWTYQNRVSRALNSKNRKAQVFSPGTYLHKWRKDKGERQTNFQGHCSCSPSPPRSGACVWLSRAGRVMRADPTQLRLASGREEVSQELHVCHPMPWTAHGELQKLQKRQHLDI